MEPIWTPGTASGYHAATFGWILDELVYRWEGRNISRFMNEAVIEPLGLKNIFIGLPPREFPRMAKMFVQGGVRERQDTRARFSDFLNTPAGMSLPLAWVGGVANARDLACLMNILAYEGTFASTTFFSKQTQEELTRPLNPPGTIDRRLQLPIRWGLGFMLGSTPRIFGDHLNPRVVGHAGGSASIAWADPDQKLSVAFLTNQMTDMNTAWERFRVIGNKVYECLEMKDLRKNKVDDSSIDLIKETPPLQNWRDRGFYKLTIYQINVISLLQSRHRPRRHRVLSAGWTGLGLRTGALLPDDWPGNTSFRPACGRSGSVHQSAS